MVKVKQRNVMTSSYDVYDAMFKPVIRVITILWSTDRVASPGQCVAINYEELCLILNK